MIVVQKLTTRWTKESRGGQAASRRNATPQALALPCFPEARPDAVLVHLVTFEEPEFEAASSVEVTDLAGLHRLVGEVELRLEPGALRVRYLWSHRCGAPERPNGRAVAIAPGSFCRLLHNGRYAYEESWGYQSTVLNFAFGRVEPHAFVETTPTETSDNRAELW